MGWLAVETIECRHHGLRYDKHGSCVFNPHGDGKIPGTARGRSYRVAERHGVVWIWMGDAGLADEARIRDFGQFCDPVHYACVTGCLHVAANYQLISDNLLDLSHGQCLHPLFANSAGPRAMEPDTAHEPETV